MRDFEKTKSIVRKWNNLVMLWPIAKDDAERKKILQDIYEFEEYAEKNISNELLEICDGLPNLPLYFDAWLNILCKLDTTSFSYPKEWEEWDKLSDEWQELWCNAIDRASGLYVEVSLAIKGFVSTYNMNPKREIPKALRTAFEAAGGTITDEAVQLANDGEKEREEAKKKPKRTFRDYMSGDDADERLEKAKQVKGHGRDALREILRITFPEKLTDYPSYPMFKQCFGNIIGRSDYHYVLKE